MSEFIETLMIYVYSKRITKSLYFGVTLNTGFLNMFLLYKTEEKLVYFRLVILIYESLTPVP